MARISECDEAIMLMAGQILHDVDPRYRGRTIVVVRVQDPYAFCMCGPRHVRVRLDHIFSDREPRRSGYSTVSEGDSVSPGAPTIISLSEMACGQAARGEGEADGLDHKISKSTR